MNESELVQRCQFGDADACRQLVAQYQGPLFGYVWARVRHRATAEDLLQETFLKIWKGLDNYHHESRLDAWVFRIAERTVVDWCRSQRALAPSLDGDWISAAPGPDGEAEGHERQRKIRQCVDELPDPYRRAVLLRFYSDLSFQEIADTLGCPLGTALSWVKRGLERLKPILERTEVHNS